MKGVHNDQLKTVIKKAKKKGWTITRCKNNHLRFFPPEEDKSIVFFSGTPSDWRAVRNLITKLRHQGLEAKA